MRAWVALAVTAAIISLTTRVVALDLAISLRALIVVIAALGLTATWWDVVRHVRRERRADAAIAAATDGAHVERVNVWRLPSGRVGRDKVMHLVVDAASIRLFAPSGQLAFELPAEELALLDVRPALGDRVGDRAVTLHGSAGVLAQIFTLSHFAPEALAERIETALRGATDADDADDADDRAA